MLFFSGINGRRIRRHSINQVIQINFVRRTPPPPAGRCRRTFVSSPHGSDEPFGPRGGSITVQNIIVADETVICPAMLRSSYELLDFTVLMNMRPSSEGRR
jgi:hypothetical protein